MRGWWKWPIMNMLAAWLVFRQYRQYILRQSMRLGGILKLKFIVRGWEVAYQMNGRGCDENQMITTNISPTFCQLGITASFLPFMRRQFGFSISGAFLLKTTDSFDTEIM